MSLPQIDEIRKQLETFGLVGEVDVPNKLWGIHEIVFNVDQPVSERAIRAVHAHNQQIRMEEGSKRRERAAIGANEALNLAASNAELPPPSEFDLEFEQMDQFQDEKRIEQGFHVKRNLEEVPAETVRSKRRA